MTTYVLKARSASTWLTATLLVWSLASAGACSSKDDNPAPSTGGRSGQGGSGGGSQSGGAPTTGGAGDAGGAPADGGNSGEEGGAGPRGGTDSGGAPSQGGAGNEGGGEIVGGSGGEGAVNDCPATDLEFLNRASDSQCSAFPNTKARLPLLKADGSLPPLPGS